MHPPLELLDVVAVVVLVEVEVEVVVLVVLVVIDVVVVDVVVVPHVPRPQMTATPYGRDHLLPAESVTESVMRAIMAVVGPVNVAVEPETEIVPLSVVAVYVLPLKPLNRSPSAMVAFAPGAMN